MANRNNVTTNLHKSFFDNIFEPERKKLQSQLGLSRLSQPQFTEFLAKSGARIIYPKPNAKFSPLRRRNGQLNIKLGF